MRDRTAVLLGLTAGAIVGGVAGWLYLTEGGRLWLRTKPASCPVSASAASKTDGCRRNPCSWPR